MLIAHLFVFRVSTIRGTGKVVELLPKIYVILFFVRDETDLFFSFFKASFQLLVK